MMYADEWNLWSTTARLVVTEPSALPRARAICDRVLGEIDHAANRFDPSSELSRLPTDGHPVGISPLLRELISESLDAAARSDGALDPTVGSALEALGYDRDIRLVQRDGAPVRAVVRTVAGWRTVRLYAGCLRLPTGVRLDLGATGKASAADRCARAVFSETGAGVLVDLGGDLATAGAVPGGGWQITVQDQPEDAATQIALPEGGAVATSSTVRRSWQQGSARRHHIIDPATAVEADPYWRSVTVVAGTCLAANTAATASVVRGAAALPWLRRIGLPARLLDQHGRLTHLNGWPGDVAAA